MIEVVNDSRPVVESEDVLKNIFVCRNECCMSKIHAAADKSDMRKI